MFGIAKIYTKGCGINPRDIDYIFALLFIFIGAPSNNFLVLK
jgi:hypothetical protein